MNQKLIFLDIDGTLTPAGTNTPPESALRAIRAAQKNGHRVFLCTGRNLAMLSPLLRFVKFYAVRGGFRDGVPGLVHIAIGCFNSFVKYAKIRERLGQRAAAARQ